MNRQAKATHCSLLMHALFLWAAFVLNQHAQAIRLPVVLDFSILPPGEPAESSRQSAPPATNPVPATKSQVENKKPSKPVVKKSPQQQQAAIKKPVPREAEKTPPAETVPVAASMKTSENKEDASTAPEAAMSTATTTTSSQGAGSGSSHGGAGGGDVYGVGQLDGPLTVLAKTPPAYPPAAKRQNIEGWIKVKFMVDEQGQVGHISVLAAEPQGVFEQSVLRSIRSWRFKPCTVKGMVVKALVEQTITFKLEG